MDATCVREVKALISQHLIFPIFIVSTIHLQVLHNKHKKGTIDKNLDFFFFTKEMGRKNMRCFLQERGEVVGGSIP